MNGTALVVTTVVALVTLAGCGGGDSQERADTVTAAPDSSPSKSTSTGGDLSRSEARSALPGVAAMPTGWSVDPEKIVFGGKDETPGDEKITPNRCADERRKFQNLESVAGDKKFESKVAFTGGTFGPFLGVQVSSYEDEVNDESLDTLLKLIGGECSKFTVHQDGQTAKTEIVPLSFPSLGEASAAYRTIIKSQSETLVLDAVTVRAGHAVVIGAVVGYGGPSGKAQLLEKTLRGTLDNLA